jgi:hypothetical protein
MQKGSNTPSPQQVRQAIKEIPDPEQNIFCKAVYVLGATPNKLVGEKAVGESAYGPTGNDVRLCKYFPEAIDRNQVELILNQKMTIDEAFDPVKIAVFKIYKKKLKHEENPFFRYVALPLDKRFEPWAEEILKRFQERKEKRVFPNKRKHYLDHLSLHGVFADMEYKTGSRPNYVLTKEGELVSDKIVPEHLRNLKLEGLRKTRRIELRESFGFNDYQLDVFFGTRYRESSPEQYKDYLPKLLKEKLEWKKL